MTNRTVTCNLHSEYIDRHRFIPMSYLVYGDYYTGLYLSLNLLRSKITGEQTGFQHTVQPAAVLQTRNTLLKYRFHC